MAIQGAGAGMAATGAYAQAMAQKTALNNQAQIATWQAQQALQVGAAQTQTSELKTAELQGQQRAQLAANGVDLGSGGATDILAGTKYMGIRDALTISDNATRTAWGYNSQATMDRAFADNVHPGLSAMSSLIGGASQVAGSWYQMKKQGVVPTWQGGKN